MQDKGNYGKHDFKLHFWSLKIYIMASRFTRDEVLLQLLLDDFGLSEDVSSGDDADQVVDPDAVKALRSAVATDNLASSRLFS